MLEHDLQRVAELLLTARHTVAFTGAGISTPSGIPDYRSPGTGLWEKMDPMAVASLRAFRADPEAFYRAMRPFAAKLLAAQPNPAHLALAALERDGLLACVITQNVDHLHRAAGSRRVWELHGDLREAVCVNCKRILPADGLWHRFLQEGSIPRCASCGRALKPNLILFGEPLPRYIFLEATGEAERCDLMLVVGASLEVAPACELPFVALRHGARVVVLNSAPTPADGQAQVVIRHDLAEVLPRLAEICRARLRPLGSDATSSEEER